MFWSDLSTRTFAVHSERADTVLWPVGSVEAHGPHCPLGTDNLLPDAICRAAADLLDDRVLVLPPVPFGHSWELAVFPGTVNVPTDVFAAYVTAVGREVVRWGMRYVVVVNGHGGNIPALTWASEQIAEASGARGPARVTVVNWWLDCAEGIRAITGGQGHAGEDETSAVLATSPHLVDMTVAPTNNYRPPVRVKTVGIGASVFAQAMTGDATRATPAAGQAILALAARHVAETVQALHDHT